MNRVLVYVLLSLSWSLSAQSKAPEFNVIGFFTARNDQAHISFVQEANRWFQHIGEQNGFTYDSTNNWDNLNAEFLAGYEVVIFLDTRPDSANQRMAFQNFIEQGGGWMGFHFAGFALTPSAFPQNWDWYHNQFIGAGQYVSNTWRPTSAILRVETKHPTVKGLPATFKSSPCEWYRWEKDLKANPHIKILLSIDPSSFPLGTGPKQHEIWQSGYYPVAWTNTRYKMVYFNMGHNDIDYEGKTNKSLSHTFGNPVQDQLILNSLLWLGRK
jgi:type 1 glutamine amidotransferase